MSDDTVEQLVSYAIDCVIENEKRTMIYIYICTVICVTCNFVFVDFLIVLQWYQVYLRVASCKNFI